jgi:hypothetical protein
MSPTAGAASALAAWFSGSRAGDSPRGFENTTLV